MNYKIFQAQLQSRSYDDNLRQNLIETYKDYYSYYSIKMLKEITEMKKKPNTINAGLTKKL